MLRHLEAMSALGPGRSSTCAPKAVPAPARRRPAHPAFRFSTTARSLAGNEMADGGGRVHAALEHRETVGHAGGADAVHLDPDLDHIGEFQRRGVATAAVHHQADGFVQRIGDQQVGVHRRIHELVEFGVVDVAVLVVVGPPCRDHVKGPVGGALGQGAFVSLRHGRRSLWSGFSPLCLNRDARAWTTLRQAPNGGGRITNALKQPTTASAAIAQRTTKA